MPLRIVFDARHIKDFGVGTYIRNLTAALAKIDRKNHYTLIIHRDDTPELGDLPPNFEFGTYDRPDSQARDNISFPAFLKRFSADLFHIPLFNVPFWMPKPYIATVHDLSALLFTRREGWRAHLRLYQVRHGLLRAEKVIAVSAATRRDVETFLAIPPGRIRQIYNAPDARFLELLNERQTRDSEQWQQHRQRILDRYQINYPFILYVGNIRPQKNIPRLVEAFAYLREHMTEADHLQDIRLIIIGDDISRYPAVRLAVMHSRVENTVRFLGFVPIDTLRVFYQAASVFAFPSLYEGFGLPPLEAMAAGTPVVASNVSSLPEVLGDAAVVVNPENVFDITRGLKQALGNEPLRRDLIARGYQQVKRFSWENNARQVLEIYQEIGHRQRTG